MSKKEKDDLLKKQEKIAKWVNYFIKDSKEFKEKINKLADDIEKIKEREEILCKSILALYKKEKKK